MLPAATVCRPDCVSTLSISRFEQIDEYLYASGQTMTKRDRALLEKYDNDSLKEALESGGLNVSNISSVAAELVDRNFLERYGANYRVHKRFRKKP